MSEEYKPLAGLLRSALACIGVGAFLLVFTLENSKFMPMAVLHLIAGLLSVAYRSTGKFKLLALLFYSLALLIWSALVVDLATSGIRSTSASAPLAVAAMLIGIPVVLAGIYFVLTAKRADVEGSQPEHKR